MPNFWSKAGQFISEKISGSRNQYEDFIKACEKMKNTEKGLSSLKSVLQNFLSYSDHFKKFFSDFNSSIKLIYLDSPFYNFTEEWHKLGEITDKLKRPSAVVNGQFKHPEVLEKEGAVLFVQYQAGAFGLNLQKANKIIYYSLPLGMGSCDLWEQSKKRIHRIGQDKTCFYYYLIVKNSIETWNLELLKTGKELTDDLFKEEL